MFPEGSRTLDGHVGPFQKGIFSLLPELQYPIVPMSIVGSFEFHRTGHWMLSPSTLVVHLHDTLETHGLRKEDVDALRERVHRTVSQPIEEALACLPQAGPPHADLRKLVG